MNKIILEKIKHRLTQKEIKYSVNDSVISFNMDIGDVIGRVFIIIDVLDNGNRVVRFIYNGVLEEILDRVGNMPLPHYIHEKLKDKERYQTVYNKVEGSAAAPTAGLHFTKELIKEIQDMGVEILEVTLDVGLGTFRPCKEEDITKHDMHTEHYRLSKEVADKINKQPQNRHQPCCDPTPSLAKA